MPQLYVDKSYMSNDGKSNIGYNSETSYTQRICRRVVLQIIMRIYRGGGLSGMA